MKATDKYHRWVAWSEEDQVYIGRCPDLFLGGVHHEDPLQCAQKLQDAIDDVGDDYKISGDWPTVKVKPTLELVC